MTATPLPPRRRRSAAFRIPAVPVGLMLVTLFLASAILGALGRLAVWSWDEFGTSIASFYWSHVFADPALRRMLVDTLIVVVTASTLATGVATVLAWINERTDATLGFAGRVLPLVPFLMPAIAFPLGWLFLMSPRAGLLNVAVRGGLARVGVRLNTGPFDIYGWPALIFLYAVFLCGFAYLVVSSSMAGLGPGFEEAAKVHGARPVRLFLRIVLPAVRPAVFSAFLMCLIVGVAMVSVPITVGSGANIPVLSVLLVQLVTAQSPPAYGEAFLIGLLTLVPILVAWWVQRRVAATRRFAAIDGRARAESRVALGAAGKTAARLFFLAYGCVAVLLPVIGLLWVAGQQFWSGSWPPSSWNPLANLAATLHDDVTRLAIVTSLELGVGVGAAVTLVAHFMSYGQHLFPRIGAGVDALVKTPAVVAQILVAIALLVTFGGKPFDLAGTTTLLCIGYLVVFLPFASVLATAAQNRIGSDALDSARVAGAGDARIFLRIVTPLSRPALAAAFLLMYVLVSGETNVSLILANTQRPVVGLVMLDLLNYGSFPQVASFALVVTTINLVCVSVLMGLVRGRAARAS